MRLKVCGMRSLENITALEVLEPDYMGFIFWAPSKRYVRAATPPLKNSIKKTGVFVDASLDYIQSIIEQHNLKAVQLHGKETPDYCQIVSSWGVEVIKAFSILDTFDFSQLQAYEDFCDYFLFDTKGSLPGGNGTQFDWGLLKEYPSQKPFFLSGGIGLEQLPQIKEILKTKLPVYAIDVNSKFETEPGLKKIEAIKQLKDLLDEL